MPTSPQHHGFHRAGRHEGLQRRDRRLSFEFDDGAWTLRDLDSGDAYRSGQDRKPSEPTDFAYLARVPRPDRRGSLLLFTGIHPAGTLGVVGLLADDLPHLHRVTGERTFSALIRVDYDSTTAETLAVAMVGQPRWQDFA